MISAIKNCINTQGKSLRHIFFRSCWWGFGTRRFLVLWKVAPQRKRFPALQAEVGLFVRMRLQWNNSLNSYLKMKTYNKYCRGREFSSFCSHLNVCSEVGLVGKLFLALLTLERFLSRVRSQMALNENHQTMSQGEMCWIRKRAATIAKRRRGMLPVKATAGWSVFDSADTRSSASAFVGAKTGNCYS